MSSAAGFLAILFVFLPQHDHSSHARTPVPRRDVIPPGGLWGPVPGAGPAPAAATPALPLAAAPRSTSDMATVNPAGTLVPDEYDAPVAASVNDALKASGGGHHH